MRGNNMRKILIALMITCLSSGFAFAGTIYENLHDAALKAGVTANTAQMLSERTKSAGFNDENMAKIQSVISSMPKIGAEKAAEKVLEGIAKNVDQARIASALERVRDRYETALGVSDIIGVKEQKRERIADMLADAMSAGAQPESLTMLAKEIKTSKQNTYEYAESIFGLYLDMVRYGVANDNTYTAAKSAMGKLNASEINNMRHNFAENAGNNDVNSLATQMGQNAANGMTGSSMGSSSSGFGGMGSSSGGMGGSGGGGSGSGGGGGGHGGGGMR